MHEPVHRLAVDHRATTDPGADADVDERSHTLSATPAMLGERGAVDVRVEGDRDAQGASQRPDEVDVLPSRLRRRGDRAERRRPRIQIDRTEAGDPEGRQRGSRRVLREERHHVANRLVGRGRGNSRFGAYICGARTDRADELGPSGLDPTDQPCHISMVVWHGMVKVTFTLDDETVGRLRRLAARLRRPLSHVVRESIKDYEARSDKLSDEERKRLLAVLEEIRKTPPTRSRAEVDAELRENRAARRRWGRRTPL